MLNKSIEQREQFLLTL